MVKRGKSWRYVVVFIVCCFGVATAWMFGFARQNEDILHLGLNAEIISVDDQKQELEVTGLQEACITVLHCADAVAQHAIYYVDYRTGASWEIPFDELCVGDQVILSIYEKERSKVATGKVAVEQIQLGTQRLS